MSARRPKTADGFIYGPANRRALRHWVIAEGEARRSSIVDRGEPLLHTPQEWLDIYLRWLSRNWSHGSKLALVLVIPLVLLAWYIVDLRIALALLACFPIAYIISYVLPRWMARRALTRKDLVPGLYRRGLEVPDTGGAPLLFFPYAEMAYVKAGTGKRPTFIEIGYRRGEAYLFVDLDFLGEDGLALLQSLAGHAPSPSPATPPRLVVYPSSDR